MKRCWVVSQFDRLLGRGIQAGGAGRLDGAEGVALAGPGEGVGVVAGQGVEVAQRGAQAVEVDPALGDAFGKALAQARHLVGGHVRRGFGHIFDNSFCHSLSLPGLD